MLPFPQDPYFYSLLRSHITTYRNSRYNIPYYLDALSHRNATAFTVTRPVHALSRLQRMLAYIRYVILYWRGNDTDFGRQVSEPSDEYRPPFKSDIADG
jgi:hypothetical protein